MIDRLAHILDVDISPYVQNRRQRRILNRFGTLRSYQTFLSRLRAARAASQLSAREFSLFAGLSPNVISAIEEGSNIPHLQVIGKISSSIGVAAGWLMGTADKHLQETRKAG